jgi:hypothetical protein
MIAKEAQKKLTALLSEQFGQSNVQSEWRSNANADDWLKFNDIYAPRPDIAVGPFNVAEGRNTAEINNLFNQKMAFFNRLGIPDVSFNENPRCLIAIEIENSNKGKHMMGNIINASLLGKIGIIVTLQDKFYREAINMSNYLRGAVERKKMGHNPLNIAIKKYDELERLLR